MKMREVFELPKLLDYMKQKEFSITTRKRDEVVFSFEEGGSPGDIGTDFAFRIRNPNRGAGYWPMNAADWDVFAKKMTVELSRIGKVIKAAKVSHDKAWDEMMKKRKGRRDPYA